MWGQGWWWGLENQGDEFWQQNYFRKTLKRFGPLNENMSENRDKRKFVSASQYQPQAPGTRLSRHLKVATFTFFNTILKYLSKSRSLALKTATTLILDGPKRSPSVNFYSSNLIFQWRGRVFFYLDLKNTTEQIEALGWGAIAFIVSECQKTQWNKKIEARVS